MLGYSFKCYVEISSKAIQGIWNSTSVSQLFVEFVSELLHPNNTIQILKLTRSLVHFGSSLKDCVNTDCKLNKILLNGFTGAVKVALKSIQSKFLTCQIWSSEFQAWFCFGQDGKHGNWSCYIVDFGHLYYSENLFKLWKTATYICKTSLCNFTSSVNYVQLEPKLTVAESWIWSANSQFILKEEFKFEEMLEKKISCNGSTAATTLINFNSSVSNNNSNNNNSSNNSSSNTSSCNISCNSNNKNPNSSSGGSGVLDSGATKSVEGMAIKTEEKTLRNICKTELDLDKDEVANSANSNGPPNVTGDIASDVNCKSSALQNSCGGTATCTTVSSSLVNGSNSGEPSLLGSPGNGSQARESTNESCSQQKGNFGSANDNISNNIKENTAEIKRAGTPVACTGAIKSEVISGVGCVPLSPACGGTVLPCTPIIGAVGMNVPTNATPTSIAIQPLPSNMVNKSSTSIESQYMQQQSQIFVFSTGLANKAAEAVLSEHYPSIIAFHCAQPGTVRFLEKHPLKVQQFHRQSSAMWLNNLAHMKQGNRQMKIGAMSPMPNPMMNHNLPGGPCGPGAGPCGHMGNPQRYPLGPRVPVHAGVCHGPGHGACHGNQDMGFGPRNWSHTANGAHNSCDPRFPNPHGNQPMYQQGIGPHCSDHLSTGNDFMCQSGNFGSCNSTLDSTKLNSVKIPDENLTPEQRQHRKEQLVILRNLGQLLLPDLHNPNNLGNPNAHHHNDLPPIHQGPPTQCSGEMCNHMHAGMNMLNQHDHGISGNPSPMGVGHFNHQKDPSNGDVGDWQRANQFYEDRNMKPAGNGTPLSQTSQAPNFSHHPITPQSGLKQQPSLSTPSPTVGASPNSTIKVQGPPPPYHQGSRCPVPSPHPASPGTISLASPHMASGLASPVDSSRSFPHPPSTVNRLSHPSPSGGSLHSTPLNSPKPLTSSNSGGSTVQIKPTTPVPNSTPNSNNPVPSPGSVVPTANGSSRKQPTTPQQPGDLEFGQLSQPLTPSSDPAGGFGSNRSLQLCGQSPRSTPKPPDINPGGAGAAVGLNKEPSLMPVPSPQQIQYLNAFEGQELTIQKQPNTSIRETELLSQTVQSGGMDVNQDCQPFPGADMARNPLNKAGPCSNGCPCGDGAPNRFQPMNSDHQNRLYPGHPHPELQGVEGGVQRFRNCGPNSVNFQNQLSGGMLRFGMGGPGTDGVRYRGQFQGHNERYPVSHNLPLRPDGNMMMRPQFTSGNTNMEQGHPHQYSSPVPTSAQMFDPSLGGQHAHNHNLQNVQKLSPSFDHGSLKTSSPLGSHLAGDESGSNSGMAGGSQRLSHFDPIASMTAMSDSALASPRSQNRNQNSNTPVFNFANEQMGPNPSGCHPSVAVNFNSHMQSMQNVNQSNNNPNTMPGPHGMPFVMGQHMGQNICHSPQTVNNTFVNATMSIQQLNIQNVTTSNFNPNMHAQSVSPNPGMMQMQQFQGPPGSGLGGNTVSSPSNMSHPIMHSGTAQKSICGPRGGSVMPQQYPGSPINAPKTVMSPLPHGSPGVMPRNPGAVGSPGYLSPNVHVKASAPNTIQYLPARPQNSTSVSNRPPSLEFLHRYASPLTNLDSKVPTHNLQYFPNAGPNNGANVTQLMTPPGGDNGLLGVDGPMKAMGQINRNCPTFMSGPQNPNIGVQLMPRGSSNDDFNRTTVIPGNSGPTMNNAMGNMGPMGSPHGMYPDKQLPLSPSGLPPDTTQPLPPSMGQTLNYKQSPFYGPTTADPNYAVQFHNFQQQLYATNTRGNQGNSQNISSNPSFFNLK